MHHVLKTSSLLTLLILITNPTWSQNSIKSDTVTANRLFEKAMAFNEKANYDSTIYYAQKANKVYEASEDWSNYVKSLNRIANSYRSKANYDTSLLLLEKALQIGIKKLGEIHPEIASNYNGFGLWQYEKSNYPKAIEYYKKSLKIWKETTNEESIEASSSYNNIAQCLNKQGEFRKALEFYTKALEIRKKRLGENHYKTALVYGNIGVCQNKMGDYEKALESYKKALEININYFGENHPSVGLSYHNIGDFFGKKSKYDEALKNFYKSIKIRTRTYGENHPLVADTKREVGFLMQTNGHYDSALIIFNEVLDIRKKAFGFNHEKVANALNDLGQINRFIGNYESALKFYNEAIQIGIKIFKSDQQDLALFYHSMSACFKDLGDYKKAIEYNQKAIDIAIRIFGNNHVTVANYYNSIAINFHKTENYTKAIEVYNKVINILQNTYGVKHVHTAIVFSNIADSYLFLDNFSTAKSYYEKSEEILIELLGENHPYLASNYNKMGVAYFMNDDYDKALFYYNKALKIRRKSYAEKHPNLGASYYNIGKAYMTKGEYTFALENCQEAIINLATQFNNENIFTNPPLRAINSKATLLKVLDIKAKILDDYSTENDSEKIKYLAASFNTYSLATQLIDTLRFELGKENTKVLNETGLEIYEGSIRTAQQLFLKTTDSSYLHNAFVLAEKSKSFFLQKAIRESYAKKFANIPDSLIIKEKDLRGQKAFYEKQLTSASIKKDSIKVSLHQKNLFNVSRKLDSLITYFENTFPEYYDLKYQHEISSINDIQSLLPDSTHSIIEYFMGKKKLFLFHIKKDKFQLFSSNIDSTLYQYITNFRNLITSKSSDKALFSKIGHSLWEKLIQPIVKTTALTENMTIIPDGQLHYLPFELLVSSVDQQSSFSTLNYLIKKVAISYNLSSTIWAKNQTKNNTKSTKCLAFAPIYDPNVEISQNPSFSFRGKLNNIKIQIPNTNLPGALQEVKAISDYTKGSFFVGEEATENNFKQFAKQYQIIHLAMHGIVDDVNPQNSRLLFAPSTDSIEDGQLHIHEIYNLQFPSQMVVLSACQTGSGKLEQGEGVISLARAFMYAGSPSLVMSLWDVDDYSTVEIMKSFYQNLKEGLPKDNALRKAKLSYLKTTDENTSQPYYWASFAPIGNTQSISIEINYIYIWLILILVILIGLLLILSKKKS